MTIDQPPRIAVVQHGDYAEALDIVARGEREPYAGMADSVAALRRLLDPVPHCVISLNAPAYQEQRDRQTLIGLPMPQLPRPLPRRVAVWRWAQLINRHVRDFRATHLLLRTNGLLAERVLRDFDGGPDSVMVAMANTFYDESPAFRRQTNRLMALLNSDRVYLVANHCGPATRSMVDYGLNADKAVPYDFTGRPEPRDYSEKTAPAAGETWEVMYVGAVTLDKGVLDCMRAIGRLLEEGRAIKWTVIGDGPAIDQLKQETASWPAGAVEYLGRQPNERVFECMLRSQLVCVPSRPSFPEGMPLTLLETLSSRTPIVASDHPLFTRTFADGQGMRFFAAGDDASCADLIRTLMDDPDQYHRLSQQTADAFDSVRCETQFGEVLDRWRATISSAAVPS